jgi:hypothetical protein
MTTLSALAIVVLAALIHASFQLSVSVLTVLSGQAIGAKKPTAKVMRLTSSFVAGSGVMTVLLLSLIALVVLHLFGPHTPLLVWAIACGLMIGVGVAVWAFYYRHDKGTTLWIPRSVARYLSNRTKVTDEAAEAFALGLMSVLCELLFIFAPLFISALVLVQLDGTWQLVGILIYAVISLITLFSVWVSIGSGHKLSEIQRWREANKHFLQFAAGAGLIILGVFTYVYEILGSM